MTRALILGGGMIGSAMAMDLGGDDEFEVTVADLRPGTLAQLSERYGVGTQVADLGDAAEIARLAGEYDIVLGALPSAMGLATLDAMIGAGKPYVDISFMADDPLALGPKAEAAGVPVIVDCGVGPGMSNMIAGYAAHTLDTCDQIDIYVGGLPIDRRWPYQYKAPFAPTDVIEEYTRPARMVERGEVVVYEPLSGVELLDFPGIGTLEAFNTDGLRSLIATLDVPNLREKTMRYPGHAELMRILRETGFFSQTPIEVDGQSISPVALSQALLFPQWKYEEGEPDLTVMRIEARGTIGDAPTRLRWDLVDRYDPVSGLRSMSRTTGFPATVVARLVANGRFTRPGVHPPEILGREPGLLDEVLAGLASKGVVFHHSKLTP